MVAVTARRSGMRRTTRKRQVSTLESIMEWFQRKKTIGVREGGGSGDPTAATAAAKTRTSKQTSKPPAFKSIATVTPPSKSKTKSYSSPDKQIYPVKRSLGLSKDCQQLLFRSAATELSAAPASVQLAKQHETTQKRKQAEATRPSPVKKNTVVSSKHVIPHKKAAVPAKKRSPSFASSLISTPLKSLASSLASSTMKLFPSTSRTTRQQTQRRAAAAITTTTTTTTEHSEAMAVSHALQDALDAYLKDHPELSTVERRELMQWAKTAHAKLHVCDRQIMEQIRAEDQIKLAVATKKVRDEIEGLKSACMEAEIQAKASRLLFKIDALR